MLKTVYLSVAFDPRELWFQAGFSYKEMQIAQWSQDFDSASRVLECFLNDENEFTGTHLSVRAALAASSKVVVYQDQKALASLKAAAQECQLSVEVWLQRSLGKEVEVRSFFVG